MKDRLLKNLLLVVVVIGLLYFLGNKFYFHWTVWWFDMLLHFISGYMVALGSIIFVIFSRILENKNRIVLFSLAITIIVGVVWEIFELGVGLTTLLDGNAYIVDTTTDLILDTLGGILAVVYFLRLYKNKSI